MKNRKNLLLVPEPDVTTMMGIGSIFPFLAHHRRKDI